MPIFKTGDGTEETVLFVTLPLVTPDWFRIAVMGALREMTVESNWFVEGDADAAFARDKAVEMINGIEFSEENPLPVYKPPVGTINFFADDNMPAGWLACHGQSLLRADYAELFALIGTRFGTVDSTHFNLPDMQSKFPVGAYHNVTGYELGDTGGAASVTLATSQIPAHVHNGVVSPNNPVSNRALVSTGGVQTVRAAGTSDSEGGGGSHENRPPYIALETMIYTGVE
jgi:microcystin-dependent protein